MKYSTMVFSSTPLAASSSSSFTCKRTKNNMRSQCERWQTSDSISAHEHNTLTSQLYGLRYLKWPKQVQLTQMKMVIHKTTSVNRDVGALKPETPDTEFKQWLNKHFSCQQLHASNQLHVHRCFSSIYLKLHLQNHRY